MTNKEREQIIQNAIRDYKNAVATRDIQKICIAINDMENAYICVCLWGVNGSNELRQLILSAKEKVNKMKSA